MNKKQSDRPIEYPICLCLGLCFGTALGILTNHTGLWTPIGMFFGICIAAAVKRGKLAKDDDNERSSKKEKRLEDET